MSQLHLPTPTRHELALPQPSHTGSRRPRAMLDHNGAVVRRSAMRISPFSYCLKTILDGIGAYGLEHPAVVDRRSDSVTTSRIIFLGA